MIPESASSALQENSHEMNMGSSHEKIEESDAVKDSTDIYEDDH